jgi:hypothetical protein
MLALEDKCLALRWRALSPRNHGVAWMLEWRDTVDSMGCDNVHAGGVDPMGYMAYKDRWSHWRLRGGALDTSCGATLLVDGITSNLDMCTLGV